MTGPKYGGKVSIELYLALALHPRYRRLQQVEVSDAMRREVEQLLKQEAESAFLRRRAERPPEAVTAGTSSSASALTPGPSNSASSAPVFSLGLEPMADDEDDPEAVVNGADNQQDLARASADREYAAYFLDKTGKDVKSGQELLQYWKQQSSSLPCLADVARKIHGIPASSAKAERTFSEAGRVIEKLAASQQSG